MFIFLFQKTKMRISSISKKFGFYRTYVLEVIYTEASIHKIKEKCKIRRFG